MPLEDFSIRIVACNYEVGEYHRGKDHRAEKHMSRIVAFSEPVRGVLLYSKRIERVPKGADLTKYVEDTIPFDPVFDGLYPSQVVGGTHGVGVGWELQLVHDDLVDIKLTGGSRWFSRDGFPAHETDLAQA